MKTNQQFIIIIILLLFISCGKKEKPFCNTDLTKEIVRISYYTNNLKKEFFKYLDHHNKNDITSTYFLVYHYQNLKKSCQNFKNNFANNPTCRSLAIHNDQVSNEVIEIHPSHIINDCQVTIDQYEQHFINYNIDYNRFIGV